MANALIFIPDISGFTNFVNNTEINHAQHIISELLEVIIDSDNLKMTVSEVEGDAVLFYKMNIPALGEILEQTKNTFINFHHHLRKYEIDRVCQCGACTGAAGLSLKIIVHQGEIGFTRVREKEKPFGGTVVEAHRLLKNSIENSEYVLITSKFFKNNIKNISGIPWAEFQSGENEYDGRSIEYSYSILSKLHNEVKEPTPTPPPIRIDNPVKKTIYINKPLYYVFEFVNNLDFRLLWNKGINKLEYEEGKLNRNGTKHRCLFDGGFADFETVKSDFGEDTLVYGEKIYSPLLKELAVYYVMREKNRNTELTLEWHYKTKRYWGWIMIPIVRFKFMRAIDKTLSELSEIVESSTEIVYRVSA